MAEIWYMEMNAENLDGQEPRYSLEFTECIELLKLSPQRWKCEPDKVPNIKTGNAFIDESGYVGVVVVVTQDEIEALAIKGEWKAGWYLSPLTLVGTEKAMASKKGK